MYKIYSLKYINQNISIYTDKYSTYYRLDDVIIILGLNRSIVMNNLIKRIYFKHTEITALCFCEGEQNEEERNKQKNIYNTHLTENDVHWYLYVSYRIICRLMEEYTEHDAEYNKLFKNYIVITEEKIKTTVEKVKIITHLDILKFNNYCLLNIYRALRYFTHIDDWKNHVELNKVKQSLIKNIFSLGQYIDEKTFLNETSFIPSLLNAADITIPLVCKCGIRHINKSFSYE